MSKWADYCIYKVKYDIGHERITKVKIMKDEGEKLGETSIVSRENVIKKIDRGIRFITVYSESNSERWSKGEEVIVVIINGRRFIKTENNSTKVDNLGGLPEF